MSFEDYMLRAISLAEAFKYTAKPNPVVGALLVSETGIISEGSHERFGENHAEINAINNARKLLGKSFNSFEDLTLVCTLEPCSHFGKTGPCAEAIAQIGIKKVIFGALDPNPLVAGKGIDLLIKNDVKVEVGLCQELVKEQNKFFFFKHEKMKPYIAVKIASSLDGKSHNKDGSSTWITCAESREDVQNVRALYDAILTGGNTVIDDNPRMNARVNFEVNQPKKILLSKKNNFDMESNFFKNAEVTIIKETNIAKVINSIYELDHCSVLVEAGPRLVNAFLKTGLVDELIEYKSSEPLGKNGINWFSKNTTIENLGFKLESTCKIKSDVKNIYKKC